MVFAITGFSVGVKAQDASKPAAEARCTTGNGVSTGAGCSQTTRSPDAGAVEKGMPAPTHQQELLKTDGKASGGQNWMQAELVAVRCRQRSISMEALEGRR